MYRSVVAGYDVLLQRMDRVLMDVSVHGVWW